MATTSAPHESHPPRGHSSAGVAAARTEELYAHYRRTVHGLCRALLRNHAEAEDATQQTFLSAHRALLNGSEPREPAAWLATIARNECWARIRTRMREPLPTEELETVSLQSDPLAEAIRQADLAALWAAIEELPKPQRDALLLREFGGLSYEELAAALAVSGPAIESLLFRARQRLRVRLSTVYASLSGASWIEALVRVFAGGSVPVAAKVAALGVGAAAVGGGAVVVPQVLENHTHMRPVHRTPAVVHRARPKPVAPVLVAQTVTPPQAPAAVTMETRTAEPVSHEQEHGDAREARGDGGDDRKGGSGHEGGQATAGEHEGSGRHGGGGHDGGGDGDRHDGGGGGGDGGHGADGGEDGGIVTTPELPPVPTPGLPGD